MFLDSWKLFGPFLRQYVIVISVNLSVLGAGLGFSWSSPVLVKLTNSTSPVLQRPVTESEGSWIISICFISGLMSNLVSAYFIDLIGRKYCFILSAVPRIACYLVLYLATDVWMLLLGRFLIGLADGCTFTVVPVYASEIASKEIRGSLGTMFQIFSSLGIVIMLSAGPFLDYYTLNKVVLCIVVATSIPLIFLPDSPYFLNKKGKTDEAVEILTYLRGSTSLATEELKEYQAVSNEKEMKLSELLKSKIVLKAFAIVIIIGVGAQLTGFNGIAFYLQTILVSTKTSVSSEMASVTIGLIQLAASFCAIGVIDRFGRKPILSVTLVGLTIGMMGLSTFFYMARASTEITGFLNFLPLCSLVLVVFCFSAGLGSLAFPLMAELFDGPARAKGMFFGLFSSSVTVFLLVMFLTSVTNLIGPAAMYGLFGLNSILLLLFILYCVPETKGKTFSEIQAAMGSNYSSGKDSVNVVLDKVKV